MKDLSSLFSRRYSAVSGEDDQAQKLSGYANPAAAVLLHQSTWVDKQRRKSFKANPSMSTAGILSTFFNERQDNQRGRSPKCAFLLLTIGVLAVTAGILVRIFHPYDMIFKYKLVMEPGGEIFNLWEKPPVDLYINIYLFNITNAEAFLAGRGKMRVEQVGPYVYKELMTHENVTFNANNTMSTNPSHPLVWQEHLSQGHKEDDEVVMLNIAMLAIAHLTVNKPYFFRLGLNTLFVTSNTQPIVRMTAKEFMFGYTSSITTLGNTFLPNWIHFEKVGLIDRMYDFDTDYETFFNGVPNPAIAGLYATYRGSRNLPHWNGEHCSNIELASDGTKFKSFIQPNDTLKFFRKSMCRPVDLYRTGEPKKYGSLTGYRYVFEKNVFDNGAYNEKNKCFCRKGYCQPVGLIDVTDCYYGFPISLSYPHFMEGDIGLLQNITGLSPDPAKHSSEFIVQPQSGLPLSLSAKIQINMHFNDLRVFQKLSRFSHLTVPMLWFDINMPKLSDSLDARMSFYINYLPYLDILGFWGGLTFGAFLMVFAVTRATLRMSTFTQVSNISDSKFCKANLLRSAVNFKGGKAGNNVYNPCEMMLINKDEKSQMNDSNKQQHLITRDDNDEMGESGDDDALYSEVNLKTRRASSFALEMEPAISGGSDTEEESTATLSRNSTTSSSYMDEAHSNGVFSDSGSLQKESENMQRNGCVNQSNDNNVYINGNSEAWAMGVASSLIEDIGNEDFDNCDETALSLDAPLLGEDDDDRHHQHYHHSRRHSRHHV